MQPEGATSAEGRPGRRSKTAGPTLYDFRRPTKLSREHVRTLQMVYETFARRYSTLLTSTLRAVCQVALVSIEQLTYDEYISAVANPTILNLVTLEPLPGTAIVEFSPSVAMASIDHLLGGPGGPQPMRPLSDIESSLLRSLVNRVLDELRYAFESLVEIRPRLGSIEYNPQFVQTCAASDAVVAASFEMRVGTEDCVATLCLPLATIFPKLTEDLTAPVTDTERRSREEAQRRLTAGLANAPIEVAVCFNAVRMRPEQIVGLQPGDVVPLGHPVDAPLEVTAAGLTFAHAVPGNRGSRLACLVVPVSKEDSR